MDAYDVCVRGRGAVGQALALSLARLGLRVALLGGAATAASGPDVRTYALGARAVALLRQLRVWDALLDARPAAATRVLDMQVHGDGGGHLEFSAWQQGLGELAWIVDAAALERELDAALRFAPHVTRVEAPVAAPLTALCEGRDSATRAALGVEEERIDYGQQAIAARLGCDRPHHGTAHQWFRAPDVLALLPFDLPPAAASAGAEAARAAPVEATLVATAGDGAKPDAVGAAAEATLAASRASASSAFSASNASNASSAAGLAGAAVTSGPTPAGGGRGYGLVWSLPAARARELLALDEAAFERALQEATGGAAGRLVLRGPRAAWPLRLAKAARWHGPGWVLVGDAAHAVHPLAGQGLNLGLADVDTLAAVLAERQRDEPWRALGDERLLARYARRRAAPTWAMGRVTDGLLQLFSHPAPPVRELRNRGLDLVNRLPPLKRWLTDRALRG